MGAYSYCYKCKDGPLDPATASEVLSKEQECPACHALLFPNRSMDEVVVELAERIEALEARPNLGDYRRDR
jgi:6-phosphogluconolactonase (cycloisomerase 2 family)